MESCAFLMKNTASPLNSRVTVKIYFSIITPVLNRRILVGRAVRSVLEQSFKNYEHILVDNGSTDGTYEFCQSVASEKVKVLLCPDKGVAYARNMGIRAALGRRVIILDSDNQFASSETLFDLYNLSEKFIDVPVVLTSNIDEDGKPVSKPFKVDSLISLREYLGSSGEFTPMVDRSWYAVNLHPEIPGIINEFSLYVFIQAAITEDMMLSSYKAQIYRTLGEDRVCNKKINDSASYELSTCYSLLLQRYGDIVVRESILTYVEWLLKSSLYSRLCGKGKVKMVSRRDLVFTTWLIGLIPRLFIAKFILWFKN